VAYPRGNVAAPGMTRNLVPPNLVPRTRGFVMQRQPHLKNPTNDPAVQLFTPALIINPISPSCPQLDLFKGVSSPALSSLSSASSSSLRILLNVGSAASFISKSLSG